MQLSFDLSALFSSPATRFVFLSTCLENVVQTFIFSCTKSLGPPSVVSMVELMASRLVSSPRVGGQMASSRAVSSPFDHNNNENNNNNNININRVGGQIVSSRAVSSPS